MRTEKASASASHATVSSAGRLVGRDAVRPRGTADFDKLDAEGCGVIVLDRGARLVFANVAACGLLRAGDALKEREGELRATSPAGRVALRDAIAAALTPECGAGSTAGANMLLLPRSGREPVVVAAVPLGASAGVDAGGILLLYDPDAPARLSHAVLRRLFGLTEAESELCLALLDGDSVAELARRRGVSVNTTRTLLARVFAKTGKQRQSDLVRMLGALSSMQSLGAGFAAGMAAGLMGLTRHREGAPALRLDTLLCAGLQRFPELEASVSIGEYAPGGSNKRHAHLDCLEIIYVMQGAIATTIEGEGLRITRAGDVLCLEADVMHQGRNASESDPAKFIVIKLKRKGAATTLQRLPP